MTWQDTTENPPGSRFIISVYSCVVHVCYMMSWGNSISLRLQEESLEYSTKPAWVFWTHFVLHVYCAQTTLCAVTFALTMQSTVFLDILYNTLTMSWSHYVLSDVPFITTAPATTPCAIKHKLLDNDTLITKKCQSLYTQLWHMNFRACELLDSNGTVQYATCIYSLINGRHIYLVIQLDPSRTYRYICI